MGETGGNILPPSHLSRARARARGGGRHLLADHVAHAARGARRGAARGARRGAARGARRCDTVEAPIRTSRGESLGVDGMRGVPMPPACLAAIFRVTRGPVLVWRQGDGPVTDQRCPRSQAPDPEPRNVRGAALQLVSYSRQRFRCQESIPGSLKTWQQSLAHVVRGCRLVNDVIIIKPLFCARK